MNYSKLTITLAFACCLQAQPAPDRMAWFQHDKLGMFIHFGPYCALAGEWNGHQTPVGDEAEWIMQRFNIPVARVPRNGPQLQSGALQCRTIRRPGQSGRA